MPTSYPGGIDAFTNPTATDSLASATVPHATQHANANDAIEAIETELGTNPKGAAASVKARFDAIEATGWVTSTRILDGTIVDGDINAAAAIAQSKVANLTTDLAAKAPTANPTFTGVVTAAAGSESAPSVTFTGDTNTGIYSPGADQVGIATAGTARVIVDSSGNVGVNTTPGVRFHVQGVDGATQNLMLSNNGAMSQHIFRRYNGTSGAQTTVASGDIIGSFSFQGYDGSGLQTFATIQAAADAAVGTNDAPGRITFSTTADGGTTLTERMRIDNAGLITGTGTSLGAWTSYTPTLAGTGWAIGDGTVIGRYIIIGKTCWFIAQFTFGASSTFGSASPTCSLPVNHNSGAGQAQLVTAQFLDTSSGFRYAAAATFASTSTVQANVLGTNGQHNVTNSTTPFAWASTDILRFAGLFETA